MSPTSNPSQMRLPLYRMREHAGCLTFPYPEWRDLVFYSDGSARLFDAAGPSGPEQEELIWKLVEDTPLERCDRIVGLLRFGYAVAALGGPFVDATAICGGGVVSRQSLVDNLLLGVFGARGQLTTQRDTIALRASLAFMYRRFCAPAGTPLELPEPTRTLGARQEAG